MRHVLFYMAPLCSAAIVMTSCDRGISPVIPTQPSPPAQVPDPQPSVRPPVREIQLNETVVEHIERAGRECITRVGFKVPCREFQLTPSATGALLATLTWDPDPGMSLVLRIDDDEFAGRALHSPVEARVKVVAGETYRLMVGAIGDSEWWGPFRLTTRVEP